MADGLHRTMDPGVVRSAEAAPRGVAHPSNSSRPLMKIFFLKKMDRRILLEVFQAQAHWEGSRVRAGWRRLCRYRLIIMEEQWQF